MRLPARAGSPSCADDVGAAIARLDVLREYHAIFVELRPISGLTLKPIKCVLVPTADTLTMQLPVCCRRPTPINPAGT